MREWAFGDGCHPDAAFDDQNRWLIAYREGDPRQPGRVVVRREDEADPIFATAAGAGTPAYPRIGWPWLVYARGDAAGTAVLINLVTMEATAWPGLFGNNPLALSSWWCAWQSDEPRLVQLRALDDAAPPSSYVPHIEARPTGLVSVADDGTVVRVDDVRESVAGMTNPWRAGSLVVGEGNGAYALCRLTDGRERRLWPGLDSFTPHAARSPDGLRFAVATWGSGVVRLALLTREDFAPVVVVTPPDPTPAGITVIYPTATEVPHLRATGICPLISFSDDQSDDHRRYRVELVNGSVHVESDAVDGRRIARTGKRRPVVLGD